MKPDTPIANHTDASSSSTKLSSDSSHLTPQSDLITSPKNATFVKFDRQKLFPPEIANAIGLNPETMALLEVPSASAKLYKALLLFAGHYAVDIPEKLPVDVEKSCIKSSVKPSSKPSSSSTDLSDKIERGINDVPIPRRQGPGRLSNLWNDPEDRVDPFGFPESDSDDSDSDSDSESECDEDGEQVISLGSLKKRQQPEIQRYQLGLGYAKLSLNGKVIYLNHWGFGLPVVETYNAVVYRTLVLASDEPKILKELCAFALQWRAEREQASSRPRPGRFTLFRFKTSGSGMGDWSNQGYKRSRPAKSVILPEGQLDAIVKDLRDFVAKDTKTWYEMHGLPHRRSFLFHGPPGCGKTSTIRVIAGMFRLNACFLSLTASDFSNQVLQDALSSIPKRALLVIEDVDVLFNEDRKSETGTMLTFSGLLNALDGLISVDGIITIFTTNHLEKLDPALIRGGRVDRRFEFVHPSFKQMCALFKSFYEHAPKQLAARFANTVLSRPEEEARSIATLQQHFIFTRKKSAEECVEMIPQFFAEFYPNGGRSRNPLYI